MANIDWFALVVLTFVTLSLMFLGVILIQKAIGKLFVVFFLLGFFVYSGIGISFESVDKINVIWFSLFALLFTIMFSLTFNHSSVKKPNAFLVNFSRDKRKYLLFFSALFLLATILPLVYPQNRLINLLGVKTALTSDVFQEQESLIIYFSTMIRYLTMPFFFMFLYHQKKIVFLLIYSAVIWIGFVSSGYMARSGAAMDALLLLLGLLTSRESNHNLIDSPASIENKETKRIFIALFLIGIIGIISTPYLYDYERIRFGLEPLSLPSIEKSLLLIEKEVTFPQYYEEAIGLHKASYPFQYLLWLITLPIPKILLPGFEVIRINALFSEAILSIEYGAPGFSILLPSLLGESFIVFGQELSFVYAVLLGVFTGWFTGYFSRYKDLALWNIYLLTVIFVSTRGGGQWIFSTIINNSLVVFFFDLSSRLFTRYRNAKLK